MSDELSAQKWVPLKDLNEPFNDAVNYRTRQQKEFFSRIFLRTDDLQGCLNPAVYFLIGEKGSGKTAYAAYLENNSVNDVRCRLTTMTETQYKRFVALKREGKLQYSDYANIWRPMLLNMMAQTIIQKSKGFFDSVTGKFDSLESEIERFNKDALNPEVEVAFEMVNEASLGVKGGYEKVFEADARASSKATENTEVIKHHLLDKETRLKQAIGDLRLGKSHILFIDGVDYRPEGVLYSDYLACVKGLGEAIWQLNVEFLSNIRDSKGRLKIVLLVRPDIFHKLNLYNANSRLRDNAVLLEWSTTEASLRSSLLYEATGKYFASQQIGAVTPVDAANHYLSADQDDSIFKRLLRTTFQKPRDVLTFIGIAKRVSVKRLGKGGLDKFDPEIVRNSDYTKEFADYLLGEVRDYADFYMGQEDFDLYIKFFQYMNGRGEFSFEDFSSAYRRFKKWMAGEKVRATEYLRDPEALLQFFFDVNIIGYREDVGDERERFVHFSYRERTLTNIAPKVKISATLVINSGVAKALDIGLHATRKFENEGEAARRRSSFRSPKSQRKSTPVASKRGRGGQNKGR